VSVRGHTSQVAPESRVIVSAHWGWQGTAKFSSPEHKNEDHLPHKRGAGLLRRLLRCWRLPLHGPDKANRFAQGADAAAGSEHDRAVARGLAGLAETAMKRAERVCRRAGRRIRSTPRGRS